jgi:hypothetical protein
MLVLTELKVPFVLLFKVRMYVITAKIIYTPLKLLFLAGG